MTKEEMRWEVWARVYAACFMSPNCMASYAPQKAHEAVKEFNEAFPELKSLEPYIEPDLRKAMRGLTPKQLREELIEPPKIG